MEAATREAEVATLCMQARIGAHGDDAGAAEALRLCSDEGQADAEWRVAAAGAAGDEE